MKILIKIVFIKLPVISLGLDFVNDFYRQNLFEKIR